MDQRRVPGVLYGSRALSVRCVWRCAVKGIAVILLFMAGVPVQGAVNEATSPTVPASEVMHEPMTAVQSPMKVAAPGSVKSHGITTEGAVRASLILALFVVLAIMIATRRIPALIALPLMALGIGVIAGVPLMGREGVFATIWEGRSSPSPTGSFQLYKPIVYILIGGMFARFINDARIAERIVKYSAEYGGEDPFSIALLMSAVTALIFTAVNGLPAIIMLGTVMFPVLLSLGVPPVICGSMLILAFPIGSSLSPSGWAVTAEAFGTSFEDARRFFVSMACVQAAVLLFFLSFEFLRMKRTTVTRRSVLVSIARMLAIAGVVLAVAYSDELARTLGVGDEAIRAILGVKTAAWRTIQIACVAVILVGIAHSQYGYWRKGRTTSEWSLLTPILPLVLLLVLGFDNSSTTINAGGHAVTRSEPFIIPAFLLSLAYGFFTTPRKKGVQQLGKSVIDGIADVGAPVALMLGIGMLIAAATHRNVSELLNPILAQVVPETRTGYVATFFIASPLSLYRGPLNTFGLGIGVAKLLQEFMSPAATMGALAAVGSLLDPTTTQNVWICGYLKLDINALLFKLFAYSLVMCVAGLVISAVMFFG